MYTQMSNAVCLLTLQNQQLDSSPLDQKSESPTDCFLFGWQLLGSWNKFQIGSHHCSEQMTKPSWFHYIHLPKKGWSSKEKKLSGCAFIEIRVSMQVQSGAQYSTHLNASQRISTMPCPCRREAVLPPSPWSQRPLQPGYHGICRHGIRKIPCALWDLWWFVLSSYTQHAHHCRNSSNHPNVMETMTGPSHQKCPISTDNLSLWAIQQAQVVSAGILRCTLAFSLDEAFSTFWFCGFASHFDPVRRKTCLNKVLNARTIDNPELRRLYASDAALKLLEI